MNKTKEQKEKTRDCTCHESRNNDRSSTNTEFGSFNSLNSKSNQRNSSTEFGSFNSLNSKSNQRNSSTEFGSFNSSNCRSNQNNSTEFGQINTNKNKVNQNNEQYLKGETQGVRNLHNEFAGDYFDQTNSKQYAKNNATQLNKNLNNSSNQNASR